MADEQDGLKGRDLQDSQSGGGSGEFGGNMEQGQRSGQQGGGPTRSDMSNAGGSSGTGGYGSSQNVVNQQDQQAQAGQSGLAGADQRQGGGSSEGQSRGERYDEAANGGRGAEAVSRSDQEAFADDQRAHQDRGQTDVDSGREQS